MKRRRLLGTLVAASAGLAGCRSPEPSDIPAPTETPTPCEAAPPPKPSPTSELPKPLAYPKLPTRLTPASVESFVESFERVHRYNTVLTELVVKDACVSEIESSVTKSEVTETAAGFTATVETFAAYHGSPCTTPTGEATPTPMPHADLFYREGRYRLTDRAVVRNGTTVVCR